MKGVCGYPLPPPPQYTAHPHFLVSNIECEFTPMFEMDESEDREHYFKNRGHRRMEGGPANPPIAWHLSVYMPVLRGR